jgi:magnesium transporter
MFRRRYAPVGSQPGTLVIDPSKEEVDVHVHRYGSDDFFRESFSGAEFVKKIEDGSFSISTPGIFSKSEEVIWVDIDGLSDEAVLQSVKTLFNLHELTLSDVVNVPQRPKIEEQDTYTIILTHMLSMNEEYEIDSEQISIVFGKNFVLTFQEKPGDVFEPVRDRIQKSKGPLRKSGSDYLAYALTDAIIDQYFPILEKYGDYLEDVEEELIENPSREILSEIYHARRQLLSIRRAIWPQREIFNSILRDEFKGIKKNTRTYFRDVYDHVIEIIDVVENYRELASGFMDVYLSSMSNRLNDVMKVLTVISTIFIPLSFFASLYGMNFKYMPELDYQYSYPILLATMLTLGLGMLYAFKRKGWLD